MLQQSLSMASVRSWARGLVVVVLGATLAVAGAQAAQRSAQPEKKTKVVAKRATAKASAQAPRKVAKPSKAVRSAAVSSREPVRAVAHRPSHGELAGLRNHSDPLELKSSVALVVDQDTHEVLLSKNDLAVLPIASLTKLMTGLVVSQAQLDLNDPITITEEDIDTEKGSRSRLAVGTTLTRGEMLHLALMSSENRAAHALGRTYPGGLKVFVEQMNVKAKLLGMTDTRYVEPTGLSSKNQSSARDLAVLVNVAYMDPLLRDYSTSPGYEVDLGRKTLQYNNTNLLVKNPSWDIGLQKTGYIAEAGRCLVMQTQIAGRKLIMVFLDSAGKLSRIGDAQRVRQWLETNASFRSSVSGSSPAPGGSNS